MEWWKWWNQSIPQKCQCQNLRTGNRKHRWYPNRLRRPLYCYLPFLGYTFLLALHKEKGRLNRKTLKNIKVCASPPWQFAAYEDNKPTGGLGVPFTDQGNPVSNHQWHLQAYFLILCSQMARRNAGILKIGSFLTSTPCLQILSSNIS